MTEPARFGKYSKTIREMQEAIGFLERFTEREIAERDSKIVRLHHQLDEARVAMEGMVREADRNTDPFIAARAILQKAKDLS